MRTVVTFESTAFNTAEPKPYFVNPSCFGDDVCRWLISRLREARCDTDAEPEQEDFGWFFRFRVPEGRHCSVVGYRPEHDGTGTWIVWIERDRGLVHSLFGGRHRGIGESAVAALSHALSDPSKVRNVKWHDRDRFDRGDDAAGTETP